MNETQWRSRLSADLIKAMLLEQFEAFWRRDTGVIRTRLAKVEQAATLPHAVIIYGLRRVGKSTMLAQMAHRLGKDNFYYVNFEDDRFLGFKAEDANDLYQSLVETFGERKIFVLDEVQHVPGWEYFVRRFMEMGCKFYITGSNAALLSRELGGCLTGRCVPIELFPFSFGEYLQFRGEAVPDVARMNRASSLRLDQSLLDYLQVGGIPDAIKYPELPLLRTLCNEMLSHDIANRYRIVLSPALKELAFYLLSNPGGKIVFNKTTGQQNPDGAKAIRGHFKKFSSTTHGKPELIEFTCARLRKKQLFNVPRVFVERLIYGWLLFTLHLYDFSLKHQQLAAQKVYCIDSGLANAVGTAFAPDIDNLLKNQVFIALRQENREIYYYNTQGGFEVDFYLPEKGQLVQVMPRHSPVSERPREVRALDDAVRGLKVRNALLLADANGDSFEIGGVKVEVRSAAEWLLGR